jgi:DNA-binding CsgD family transcriptional regulator
MQASYDCPALWPASSLTNRLLGLYFCLPARFASQRKRRRRPCTHAVAHGESLLSPAIAHKVLQQFVVQSGAESAGCVPLCDDLTEREREVLALIGKGHSNKEIARLLSISEKTVKNHIANIFFKLHVYDRTQAVLYAIRQGLVQVKAQ